MDLPRVDSGCAEAVMTAITRGRWGKWLLSHEPGPWTRDGLALRHEDTDCEVRVGPGATDATSDAAGAAGDAAIRRVASKPWATAEDVGQLVFALRDIARAMALGLL